MPLVNVLSKEIEDELIKTLQKAQRVLDNLEMATNELAIIARKTRENGEFVISFSKEK